MINNAHHKNCPSLTSIKLYLVKEFGHIPVNSIKESSCKEIIFLKTLIVAILQNKVFSWKHFNNKCAIKITVL